MLIEKNAKKIFQMPPELILLFLYILIIIYVHLWKIK